MGYSSQSVAEALKSLESSPDGLAADEVELRIKKYGYNRLKVKSKQSLVAKLLEPFKSWFVIILMLAAGISLLLGKQVDAVVIMVIVVFNAGIYYVQRFSADRTLHLLRQKDERKVKVWRDGSMAAVPNDQLVPGDIVLLTEGSKVAADGRIIESENLQLNESMLTGESLPVAKNPEAITPGKLIFQQTNMVFQGTIVTAGLGKFVVTATGMSTELAKIAELSREDFEDSPLQAKINRLTSRIVVLVLIIAAGTFFLGLYRGEPISEMLRFALSLTVSAVPEGLPVALTIILVFGVKRMANKKALVRNLTAVETLGQATVIVTDKTGTITKNELSVTNAWHPEGKTKDVEVAAHFSKASEDGQSDDPLEKIIAHTYQVETLPGWQRIKLVPFNQKLRVSGAIWQVPGGYKTYIKGAPEVVLKAVSISATEKKKAHSEINRLSQAGYRLIGLASGFSKTLPAPITDKIPTGLELEGLLAFADQLRPEIPDAVEATKAAGIQVIMLTGDHLDTARSFGLQSGIIERSDQSEEGSAVAALSLEGIRKLLTEVRVIARVLPEHKYKILEALEQDEVTAMTGDGVNDVPAIVKADVGIAMGNGTDAAKEASDLIILDNNYSTIVEAVREGRTILANVRKMVFYLFSTNLGEVLTVVGSLIVGLPLPLTALHVLWINLVTDGFTVVPLGLEPPEGQHMQEPPESTKTEILRRHMFRRAVVTAMLMATLALAVFWYYLPAGLAMSQTMAFALLVLVQWANALNARSEKASFMEGFRRPNYLLWLAIAGSAGLQAFIIWGPLRSALNLVPLGGSQLAVLAAAVVVVLIAGDLLKKLFPAKSGAKIT
jgi:Ca2+-transporting ATPase